MPESFPAGTRVRHVFEPDRPVDLYLEVVSAAPAMEVGGPRLWCQSPLGEVVSVPTYLLTSEPPSEDPTKNLVRWDATRRRMRGEQVWTAARGARRRTPTESKQLWAREAEAARNWRA